MNDLHDDFRDDDVRRSFAALREIDQLRAPGISRVLARRTAAPRSFALAAAWTAVLATAIVAIVIARNGGAGTPDISIAAWRAPSDALLDLTRPAQFPDLASRGTGALNTLVPIRTPSPTPSGAR